MKKDMKRILFACVALCCMTATAVAQKNATQKIIEMGRIDNQVRRVVLCRLLIQFRKHQW